MDTSETYIKMCEKAVEIQNQKAYKALFPGDKSIHIDQLGNVWLQRDVRSTDWYVIWLPRQDQLQEMYKQGKDIKSLSHLMYDFYYFGVELLSGQFTSMEQLWLAFVMKEKYNKIWDGKEWADKL